MPPELASYFERYAERYAAGDAPADADLCGVPFLALTVDERLHLRAISSFGDLV